jgi:hypothetical protein
MLRPIARLLILTLLLSSGRLLACGWECSDAVTAAVDVACHSEPTDSGAPLIGGVAHECPPDAIDPVVAAASKIEPHVIGAFFSPSHSIAFQQPAIGRPGAPTLDRRGFVPPPFLTVLRI